MPSEKSLKNLKPFVKGTISSEIAKANGSKGGKATKRNQTIADILKQWSDQDIKDQEKIAVLERVGIKNPTNKSLLVLQLIKNTTNSKTSSRAIDQIIELLSEDKEKEARIKKLELENEMLKKQINGEVVDTKIVLINDMPKDDEKWNNS